MDHAPEQNQLPTDDSVINQSIPSITEGLMLSGNKSDPLVEIDSETGPASFGSFNRTSRSGNTPRPNEQLPPFGKLSAGSPGTIELEAGDDNSDGAIEKPTDEKVWKLVLKSRKQSHKHELAELQDAHEDEVKALQVDHHEKIMVVEAEKTELRKRVQELDSSKATLEADLEAKEDTLRRLTGALQNLRQECDELNAQRYRASTESEQTGRSAPSDQVAATLAAIEERKAMQKELDAALNAKQILAKDLADAQCNAVTFEDRVREMSAALDQSPNEVANIRGVIELKDKMYSDLTVTAGELLTALTKLEENSARERKIACRKVAKLTATLENKERVITDLRRSKRHCEDVFAMLPSKVHRDDLINAMEECFQITVQENSFLLTEVERQAVEIDSRDSEIESLKTAVLEAERSLESKTTAGNNFEIALSAKDIDLDTLQMELDSIKADHQVVINQKDESYADAERKIQEAHDTTTELLAMGRDERQNWLLKSKDDKIVALEKKCEKLSSFYQRLNRRLQTRASVSAENAEAASLSEAKSKKTLAKLKEVQDKMENQQEEFRERLGLPASINLIDVLAMEKALGEAQLRIQELEAEQGVGLNRTAESSEPDNDHLYSNSDDNEQLKSDNEYDGQESNDDDVSFF